MLSHLPRIPLKWIIIRRDPQQRSVGKGALSRGIGRSPSSQFR
jgi:hypothetical protein